VKSELSENRLNFDIFVFDVFVVVAVSTFAHPARHLKQPENDLEIRQKRQKQTLSKKTLCQKQNTMPKNRLCRKTDFIEKQTLSKNSLCQKTDFAENHFVKKTLCQKINTNLPTRYAGEPEVLRYERTDLIKAVTLLLTFS
jgi:hypothetical protein